MPILYPLASFRARGGPERSILDAAFFAGTAVKSNFICNIGYGDVARIRPRAPRLAFDEACQIV